MLNKSFFIKILLLIVFVITFFISVAIYSYVFARVQNSTIFFKILDVIRVHSLTQVVSFVWITSLPVLLAVYYYFFFRVIFKKYIK
ncbi:hypothetical protein F0R75_07335 [Francisella marina]|uniref:Uncharacterized protein n=1 Tax=Francisella marina TaxID=2249302 RepID=A0ABX5ZLQ3_9GAMM|nr:hypothetical protein F0R74_09900 [Francisella marina]QEO59608.1 hypothetical protein F0R75_07335 [Francisella marina]